MSDIEKAYEELLQPSDALIEDVSRLTGDLIILGAGGKMGPSIARLAKVSIQKAGLNKKVIAVSRFSEETLDSELRNDGICTFKLDLLNDQELQSLPEVENVLYLAGTKFGTTGKEPFTWAMNAYLPGRVSERYKQSRIVVFSTGNVYPLTPVISGGAAEDRLPAPIGEYAQSCLGRERLFQFNAAKYNTPLLIYRLNYANDLKYGVLMEIGRAVNEEGEIDLRMGHVNVIWQGDANEMAIRSLLHCNTPPKILNIAGPETIAVRWIASQFGEIFKKEPRFVNEEQPTALLSNAAEAFRLFGYPRVSLKRMITLIASWINMGGKTLNKPTHFQERKGKF